MKLTKNSTGIKVEGFRGTWYALEITTVRDMNGKSLSVVALESEIWGDEANQVYVTLDGESVEEFNDGGWYCIDDLIQDFSNNEFDESTQLLINR